MGLSLIGVEFVLSKRDDLIDCIVIGICMLFFDVGWDFLICLFGNFDWWMFCWMIELDDVVEG